MQVTSKIFMHLCKDNNKIKLLIKLVKIYFKIKSNWPVSNKILIWLMLAALLQLLRLKLKQAIEYRKTKEY